MKKANIFTNPYKTSHEIRKIVEKQLDENGIIISYNHDQDADYNIVIGGDGTFIKAVHDSGFSEIPFLGINTGHLGFYNDINPKNVTASLEKILKNDVIVHNLKVLECVINTEDGNYRYKSINELVVKSKYTAIIRFDLYVDDIKLESFGGDGLIFSTPSGSTAYSLSAGGSIIYQNIDAFQITPLAAIKSALHRSLDKCLVVPKDTRIRILFDKNIDQEFSIGIDGILFEHEDINYMDIKLSKDTIQKIVMDKNWFWINIRDKFI